MDRRLNLDDERRRQGDGGELLIASEVAARLRVTTSWVYAETRAGRLPCVHLGRYYRYRSAAIERWIEKAER